MFVFVATHSAETEAIHFDALAPSKKYDPNYYEGNKNVTFKSLRKNIRFFVTFGPFLFELAEHSSTGEIRVFLLRWREKIFVEQKKTFIEAFVLQIGRKSLGTNK